MKRQDKVWFKQMNIWFKSKDQRIKEDNIRLKYVNDIAENYKRQASLLKEEIKLNILSMNLGIADVKRYRKEIKNEK